MAEEFDPPPLTKNQQTELKVKWTTGFGARDGATSYKFENVILGVGPDRVVTAIAPAEPAGAIRKGRQVVVDGAIEDAPKGDKGPRTLHAERVTVILPSAPKAELPLVIQLP